MFLFLKKKTEEAPEAPLAPRRKAPLCEFVPYYCHWDSRTLLTKNGELMQTIRVTSTARGVDYENGTGIAGSPPSLRDTIRAVIGSTIESEKFALWIHTIRKRRRIHYAPEFKEQFAAWAHEQWKKKKHWKYQYYNEIYISLLYDGQDAKMLEKDTFRHFFPLRRNREYRNAYLEKSAVELERVTSALVEKLSSSYDAYRLSVIERERIFYSEPMEFLGHLINLRGEPFPVTEADVSQELAKSDITFGFNALEIKTFDKRRFAALLTLKQYCEVPPDTADRVLQAPMELVISQAFSFIPGRNALAPYRAQKSLFSISGDEQSIITCGINDMVNSDKGRPVDFGEHQLNIMVLADDYKQLDNEIVSIKESLGDFGLIPIREDIKLEEAFWSQLPGNFEFLRRKSTINTARIAGLCRLNRFAAGKAEDNHWGPAVTLVPTTVHSPCFFNFHYGDNGHTALLDFNSFHDQTAPILLNFLLTEARKYNGRLCIFDHHQSAQLLFDNFGGKYHTLPMSPIDRHPHQPPASLKINPFSLEDNPRNRAFLAAWCATLMAPAKPTDAQKEILRAAIDKLYEAAPDQRHLPAFIHMLSTIDPPLAKILGPWHDGGKKAYLFEDAEDGFNASVLLNAFDMTHITQHPELVVPVFSYLMHKLVTSVDGQPTIIVLHNAMALLENPFFAPRLESLLEMLKQNNAIVIFMISNPLSHISERSFNIIMQHCATHMYLPDDIPADYISQNLGLDESDEKMLLRMNRQKGEFLVKQGGEATGFCVDFSGVGLLRSILANDSKDLTTTAREK